MNRLRPTLVAVLACLLLAVPVAAQSPLDERVDMDLKDADVRETLRAFGQIMDLDSDAVAIGPGVEGELTLTLSGVRIETLLTAVCESVGCAWSFDGERLSFRRAGETRRATASKASSDPRFADPVDISLKNARLGDLLRSFASIVELPLELDPAVDEEALVTVELDNVPFGQALASICEMNDCRWSIERTEDREVLRVTAR